jgi:hypothetical protein
VKGKAYYIDKLVDQFKKKIKKEKEDIMCVARKLQLFLAMKGDSWLSDDDQAANDLKVHKDTQASL